VKQPIKSWIEGVELSGPVATMPRRMLIGGAWLDASSGQTIETINPATGGTIARVARGAAVDVDRAVSAARAAFDSGSWQRTNAADRANLMWRLADLIERHGDELAMIEALDNGKPVTAARQADIPAAAATLRYAAGWAGKIGGQTITVTSSDVHAFTVREPIGVAGLIVPWNFPLMMAVNKVAAALAAGCCMVLKPDERTSLSTLRLGELIAEAGFPDGVVNIITGYGVEAGAAIAVHHGIDKLSFTGSTAVGKTLIGASAGNLKRLTLELGGKSPSFIFEDADLELAVSSAFRNIFYNCGQICAAGSRVYIHRSIYHRVTSELARRAEAMRIGPGVDRATELGPVVSDKQLARVCEYVTGAVREGATVRTGGGRSGQTGYFMQPTILSNTRPDMAVRREEIFGPVLCVSEFEENDLEALAREANDTDYGLSAYVFTRDLSTAHRMARLIRAGFVRINGAGIDEAIPFGGYKQSGWGRENGQDGVLAFTELKSVAIAI
jgi:phenylacetaldehyde dehydrogenase